MKIFLKNLLLVVLILVGSHFLALPFGFLLSKLLNIGGSIVGDTLEYYMFGLPVIATVLVAFFFSFLTDKYRFLRTGIILIPAFVFEMMLAPILSMYSFILAGVALISGAIARKALCRTFPSLMSKIL